MDRHHHHHDHHHHRREQSPPPPPPPQVTHVHHTSHNPPPPHHLAPHDFYQPPPHHNAPHDFYQPPPPPPHHSAPHDFYQPQPPHHSAPRDFYPPPPQLPTPPAPVASVHHVSHHPHMPSFTHHHETNQHDPLADKPSVRVYSKANPDYSLTIRHGKVILAPHNPSDLHQHWIKDLKHSTRVKDEEGFPAFALINKATGQAMKHSVGATHPVQLIPYNANHLDESILWTESRDLGDSYRTIRMVNNIRLNVDAFNGDKQHGGVVDGTKIVLWEWKKGDNQRWKIIPYCKSLNI